MGSRRVPQRQRADRISAPLRAAGRRTAARIGSHATGGRQCKEEAHPIARDCRRRFSRRRRVDVRVNASGGIMLVTAAVLVVAGMWGGIVLGRRAEIAERHLGLFRIRTHRHGGRRHPAAQTRRRQRSPHHRSLSVYGTRPGAHGRRQRCAAPNASAMPWDRRSRSGISHPNPRRAGSMATRRGRRRAGRRRPCRLHADCTALVLIQSGAPPVEPARLRAAGHGHGHEGREEEHGRGDGLDGALRVDHVERRDSQGKIQSRQETRACGRRADSDRVRPGQHASATASTRCRW